MGREEGTAVGMDGMAEGLYARKGACKKRGG